jgi:excisionase family DNA binding protein
LTPRRSKLRRAQPTVAQSDPLAEGDAMTQPNLPAYSVARLAERWDCSQAKIYAMIKRGELIGFRLGTTIRISAKEVESFECSPMMCNATAEPSPLSGEMKPEPVAAAASMPKIERARRPRPAAFGKPATVIRGQWGD